MLVPYILPHCLEIINHIPTYMAGTFSRGAHTMNFIFSKQAIRKYYSKGSSNYGDGLREPMKMEAEEVKKKSFGGNHVGSCSWVPHEKTGIYYPKGQEKMMEDVPVVAAKDNGIHWFMNHE